MRASTSSVLATASDYGLFVALGLLGFGPAIATFFGCMFGAVVNFGLNRYWAFEKRGPPLSAATRYALVSCASALANGAAVAACTGLLAWRPHASWWLARTLVFTTLTFPLFRSWVFGGRAASACVGDYHHPVTQATRWWS